MTTSFLETSQYSRNNLLANESVYGRNFCSTGGETELARMIAYLGDARPRRIIDVGSGLGGASFWLARRDPACIVDGIELLPSIHALSQERLAEQPDLAARVRLLRGDILDFTADEPYDLVYSNGVFLHIHDKPSLLQRLARLVAPGGALLFGDYCLGAPGPEMTAYIERFRYHMMTLEAWSALLQKHGFVVVRAVDDTEFFLRYSLQELHGAEIAPLFREVLPKRIGRIERGEHRWCVFHCTR